MGLEKHHIALAAMLNCARLFWALSCRSALFIDFALVERWWVVRQVSRLSHARVLGSCETNARIADAGSAMIYAPQETAGWADGNRIRLRLASVDVHSKSTGRLSLPVLPFLCLASFPGTAAHSISTRDFFSSRLSFCRSQVSRFGFSFGLAVVRFCVTFGR